LEVSGLRRIRAPTKNGYSTEKEHDLLLKRHEDMNLLFISNFTGSAGTADTFVYRGDLVLVEGDIADASGRRKPPTATTRQSVRLAKADKLVLAAGL
jgi:hypothetical protein